MNKKVQHPLIGMPCLYRRLPAIPYEAHLQETDGEDRIILTIIAFRDLVCRAVGPVTGVDPDGFDLAPLMPGSVQAQKVGLLLRWLVDHRSQTLKDWEWVAKEDATQD